MKWNRFPVSWIIAIVFVLIPSRFAFAAITSPSIIISSISAPTTEAGGKATFTVVLGTQPTANVSFGLMTSDPTEGTVTPSSVTFTTANWNVAQTVTVTGVNDSDDDGDFAYSIITPPATSTDPSYNGFDPANVAVTNVDNDAAGMTITSISGDTTEAGGTATFSVKLNSRPQRNVNLGLASSDLTEGAPSTGLLIYTSSNWNVAQTVTVRGIDDPIVDGKVAYSIVTMAAISGDSAYNGMNPADVVVSNVDNDVVNFIISPNTSLTTSETGGTATFTIVPSSRPNADVTINLSSSDLSEGTVSPASVTFTNLNWNTPQSVTVRGVNDFVVDGNVAYSIVTAASVSADPTFNNVNPANVAVTNLDNDVASVIVSTLSGAATEAGGKATFLVKLTSEPLANVTVGLSSSDTSEALVAPSSLVFTAANWNVAQTVTITGVDDSFVDGNKSVTIVTAPAVSTDVIYSGKDAANVTTTNADNEGIKLSASAYTINESTALTSIEVVLTGSPEPGFPVKVNYAANNTGNAVAGTDYSITPGTLTFVAGEQSKTFQVAVANDLVAEGNETFGMALSAPVNGLLIIPSSAVVTIPANDSVAVDPAVYNVNEANANMLVTVKLNGPTSEEVTVNYATSNGTATAGSDYTATSGTLTFAAGEVSKTITVKILDDTVSEASESFSLTLSNPTKVALASQSVATITIAANDPIAFSASAYNVNENAGNANVVVQLTGGAATGPVSVNYATSNGTATAGSDYTATSGTLTFAVGESSKTIVIPIKEDALTEAAEQFTVTLSNPVNGVISSSPKTTVTIVANDTIAFHTAAYSVNEANALATITIRLNAPSSDIVTVNYATSNGTAIAGSDYTATSGTLTFAPGETTKTFTVSIINDTTPEPSESLTLTLSNPVNAGIGTPAVTLTIVDND